MAEGLMAGKRGLIMGVANNRSIAWGIAKALHAQGAEIDAIGAQEFQRFLGEGVVADGAAMAGNRARPPRRQRLVGALAARRRAEAAAAQRFTGRGQALHGGDEVEIDGADDGDQESLPDLPGS